MILIIIFLLSSVYSSVLSVSNKNHFNISGICGYPGEPLSAQHNIENQRVFSSGHIVSYQCVDFLGFKQERTCLGGQWQGPQPRCGYGKDNDIKRVVVRDCIRDHIIEIFDSIKLQKNFDRFVNSFSTERYDEMPVRVSNSTCLRWHFYLKNRSNFQFVRIDFATAFEGASKSSKEVPVVTAFVAKNIRSNQCENENMKQYKYIFANKWINYGYKYHFYLSCHTNRTESQNVLIVETVTKGALTLDLVRFSVAEVYGSVADPACGLPEMPVGVIASPIREYQLYELFCDEPYFTNTTHVTKTQMVCTSDAFWSGSYPKCQPRMSCANAYTFKHESNAQINSMENVFYYNKTFWFAINGTLVNYQCKGQTSNSLKIRKCLSNGLWDREEPFCKQIDQNNNEGTLKPEVSSVKLIKESIGMDRLMPIYVMVAFTSLTVIIIAITALVLIWKKINRIEYNDPNEGSAAQNEFKECKEKNCEVIGWINRPITTNTYIGENQSIYTKQHQYQSEDIYDVPPNNSYAVPFRINKDTELDQNLISEPIYDRPKH